MPRGRTGGDAVMRAPRASGVAALTALTLVIVLLAAPLPRSASGQEDVISEQGFVDLACSLPPEHIERIARGIDEVRSGQIVIVPREPDFVGFNFPHSGPWEYLQRVPLLVYGPGIIPARGSVDREIDLTTVASSTAALLDFPFPQAATPPAPEISAPDGPPPLIVTFVWDGAGRETLDLYPDAWPTLRSLIDGGVWFDRAIVGSSPTITPATHSMIGTGLYPRETGQTDAEMMVRGGLVRAWGAGPSLLSVPTLADLYDRALGNEPLVGTLASVTWHLNMMGHGAMWGGGDRDIAVIRQAYDVTANEGTEGTRWNAPAGLAEGLYEFLPYVNELPSLFTYVDRLDREDGRRDLRWHDTLIGQLTRGWGTPARVPYQMRMTLEVIEREGFGADDVPDLLYLNSKLIDSVGHMFSINSVEMEDSLRWQDEGLRTFIEGLDRIVGVGRWVLILTADHGSQFDPAVTGAQQVTTTELRNDLAAAFPPVGEDPVILAARPTMIYLDEVQMEAAGYSVAQISSWLMRYTRVEGTKDPSLLPSSTHDETFFEAAFPSSILSGLSCG